MVMVMGIQRGIQHCLLRCLGMVAELLQERGRRYLAWLRVKCKVFASKGEDGGVPVLDLAACPARLNVTSMKDMHVHHLR